MASPLDPASPAPASDDAIASPLTPAEGGQDGSVAVDETTLLQHQPDPFAHLSEEERVAAANDEKEKGNKCYAEKNFASALVHYSEALRLAPSGHPCRAVFYSNRAACNLEEGEGRYDEVIQDATFALEIDPKYVKALMRRAKAYEAQSKENEALKDWKAVHALDPSTKQAEDAIARLSEIVRKKQEDEKDRMLDQLKEMGKNFLGSFGISLDNLKMEKDPNTGSYSIKMG